MAASGYRISWKVPMYVIEHGLQRGEDMFLVNLEYLLGTAARRMKSYAQTNHPWQNRTGDAERTFSVEVHDGGRRMTMEHGVFYGKYLESMQGGRYGIIPATFTYGKPLVQRAMQQALDEAFR